VAQPVSQPVAQPVSPPVSPPVADRAVEVSDERRSAPVELLWDLVFVFAITQVTTLLWRDLTWAGFGRAMLVLALVRIGLWVLAAAIDYAGPAWLTRERLRGLQRVAVAHFAERYSLFVIICLGESIVAIGVGALGPSAERSLTVALVVAVAIGLLITLAMWWTYFEGLADRRRRTCAGTTTRCSRPPTRTATCTS
jgi:low temperature requirement protein LtrA